jgi:hypothetical protein
LVRSTARTASHPSRQNQRATAAATGFSFVTFGSNNTSNNSSGSSSSFARLFSSSSLSASSSTISSRRGVQHAAASVFLCRAHSSSSSSDYDSDSLSTSSSEKEKNAMSAAPNTTRVVLWFRNDLRLSDNYMVGSGLYTAVECSRPRKA